MIAFFIRGIYPCYTGGMEIFYYNLTKAFSEKENIIIITDCRQIESSQKIKVLYVTTRLFFLRRSFFGKLSLFLTTVIQVFSNRQSISLINVSTTSNASYYGLIFPFIKNFLGIPYVVSYHGGGISLWPRFSSFHLLFKSADRLIAVSSVIKELVEKQTGKSVQIIIPLVPFMVSTMSKSNLRRKYGLSDYARIILFAGSLKPVKGARFLVESLIAMKHEYLEQKNIILLLAGDGEEKKEIEELILKENYSGFVRLLGIIPNEIIHELYALSDIYIIASEFEGTSKSLLEAMKNKLPIIASNVRGVNNIIKDEVNGLLFEFNNSDSIISKLKRIIENKLLSEALGEAANDFYERNYSFSRTLQAYSEVFDGIGRKPEI